VFVKRAGKGARRVAVVRAARNQIGYEWLASAPSAEAVYAVAVAEPGCAAARSATVSRGFRDLPSCGAERVEKCSFYLDFFDDHFRGCVSFVDASDHCEGSADSPSPGWATNVIEQNRNATFEWDAGFPRSIRYLYALERQPRTGYIAGFMRCSREHVDRCADYTVTKACNYVAPGPGNAWYTPDQPDKAPGTDGGPLYLSFEPGATTHVIIWGTLYWMSSERDCA
jgi:hypothetical protein